MWPFRWSLSRVAWLLVGRWIVAVVAVCRWYELRERCRGCCRRQQSTR